MDIENLTLEQTREAIQKEAHCVLGDNIKEMLLGLVDRIESDESELAELRSKLSAMESELSSLPAKWSEDSSLETWFPYTKEELDHLRNENQNLRAYKESAEAKLKEYEQSLKLSGEVNARLVGELLDRQAVPKEVARILERILKWHGEFPETDAFYDGDKSRPISYAAAYGSNGERDFMRGLAATALELLRDPSHIHESEKGA